MAEGNLHPALVADILLWTDIDMVNAPVGKRSTTAERAKHFSDNLKYEMTRAKMDADGLFRAFNKLKEKINTKTIERWLNGERGNLEKRHRRALSKIFGYHDPDSILKEDHIASREVEHRPSLAMVPPDVPPNFTMLLKSFDDSLGSTKEQTIEKANELLDSPLGPYVSIAVHWLNQRKPQSV